MPSKSSKKKPVVTLPHIPKEVIDQFVSGPMTAEAVNAASMAFKKMLCTQLPLLLRRTRFHPLGIGYAIQRGKDWCQALPQELRAIWAKVVHVLDVTDLAHMLSRKAVKRTKPVNSTGRNSRTELNDRSGNGGHTSPVPKSALHVGRPVLLLNLQKVEGTPANSIVVDMSRVTELRQAIREGRFNVDVNKVADRLVESARWMLSVHPLKE